jgi:hypothetical protein
MLVLKSTWRAQNASLYGFNIFNIMRRLDNVNSEDMKRAVERVRIVLNFSGSSLIFC